MAGEHGQSPLALALLDRRREGSHDPRAGSPRDVEAGHGVPRPDRAVAAALRPAHDREETDPTFTEPRALLPSGELQICLGPPARPLVFGAIEPGVTEPVLSREFERVLDAEAPLLGGVDEEQPSERPPGLPAEVRARLLIHQDDAAPGIERLGRGDQAGQPPSDHQDVCGQGLFRHGVSVDS